MKRTTDFDGSRRITMVEVSGSESIVRFNGRVLVCYIIGWMLILCAVFILIAAFGFVSGDDKANDEVFAAVMVLATALLVSKVFPMARAFSQAYAAVGPDGVRLRLLKRRGLKYTPLPEKRFKLEEIGDITYGAYGGYTRVCRFRAGKVMYALYEEGCPSPRTVAKLMAEMKGVPLA
jgi:hypothetical protein